MVCRVAVSVVVRRMRCLVSVQGEGSMNRGRVLLAVAAMWLVLPARASGQAATISGKVTSESGQPVEAANVYINQLGASVNTNAAGNYTIAVPAARVSGQKVHLRVRAIGHLSQMREVTVQPGLQTQNFTLPADVNRLSEVVVTGVVEGTERAKVPFSIGRVTAEDLPVPGLDPIRALAGKVSGMRIAQTSGRPGTTPEIQLPGPPSTTPPARRPGPPIAAH